MRRAPAAYVRGGLIALLLALGSSSKAAPAADADLIAAGKRLYREGRTSDGALLQAAVRNDVALQGSGLACANCHRRSGLGSSEGGVGIPPITGNTLFTPQTPRLVRDYRHGDLSNIARPAYTEQTLARALRDGISAADRALSPMMPRFQLSDQDVAAIGAYLHTLSAAPADGITEQEIHFATVVAPDAGSSERTAMLEVMQAYFRQKNAGTRGETRRAERAPFHKEWSYSAYRTWVLHEWRLHGAPETWAAQLTEHYRSQPVFALIGGIGHGDWQPVHTFCERQELPCLFPHLDAAPAHAERDFYSIYFSRGVQLEADALAAYLRRNTHGSERVLQVLRPEADALAAAAALRAALSTAGEEQQLLSQETPDAGYWQRLLQRTRPDILVLWLREADLAGLTAALDSAQAAPSTYLSSTLLPNLAASGLAGRHGITLLHPFLLPGNPGRSQRLQIWARQAGIELREPRVQADAYFAVTLTAAALMHIRGNFSRDYLIERIEHMADSMLYTSLYPRLDLAPGQRYAAKGAYLWVLDEQPQQAQWIVP